MWPRRSLLALVATALAGAALLVAAGAPPALADSSSPRRIREDLRFAAEMAEKGLWKEALFRWRRVLEARPNDPSLHNNIGVALEALGDRDGAIAEYEAALAIAESERVRANYELARRAEDLAKDPDEEKDMPLDARPARSSANGTPGDPDGESTPDEPDGEDG